MAYWEASTKSSCTKLRCRSNMGSGRDQNMSMLAVYIEVHFELIIIVSLKSSLGCHSILTFKV